MMHLRRALPVAWAVISILFISTSAFGQGKSPEAQARHFGIGKPSNVQELPYGKLRKNLEKLPLKAQSKALKWLQRIEFPLEDVESLHVNDEGDISYVDAFLPENASSLEGEFQSLDSSLITSERIFSLHSNPGASNVVFLDFDGHTIEATSAWTNETLEALPFDPSQNDSPATVANFTQDELTRIFEIWHRMSEDFAAFNIDVTTEEPSVFTPTTGHVLFTHTLDANGKAMPSNSGGGVAYLGVFGRSEYVSKYSPALVYYSNLAIGAEGMPYYNAEAGSHEFGHNVGLSHDGTVTGITYYEGSGTGYVSWAPIMGKNYHGNLTIWSKGEYEDANNNQDDIATIADFLGYRGDDHSDSSNGATPLVIESNGDILVSSPEIDPDNVLMQNKGIIDDRDDTDWFYFDSSSVGNISISAIPAWHSFTREERRGANLDIDLTLYDAQLNVLAYSEPDDDTQANISVAISSGRHYLQVDGVENFVNSDYSDYSSAGMYFLEGTIDAVVSEDNTAPSPGTMAWESAPRAISDSEIVMTAITATDDSSPVEYLFKCVVGGQGCIDSGWQTSATYTAENLAPETYYAFSVMARDGFGNENDSSPTAGDTTQATPVNIPPSAIAVFSPDPAVISKGNGVDVTLDGSASHDEDGTIVNWLWQDSGGNTVTSEPVATIKLREGTYNFTLIVTDDLGAYSITKIEVTVTKGGGNEPSKGKGKPSK